MQKKNFFLTTIFLFCFIAVGNIFPQLIFNNGMPDLEFGAPFHFKYYLSATESTGHIQLVADLDDLGGFDSTWHPISMGRPFMDNGPTDMNDTVGVYESDFYDVEVPVSSIVNVQMALIVEDGSNMDFAVFTVFYDTTVTPLAHVHGSITYPIPATGMVVVAEEQMDFQGPVKSPTPQDKLMAITLVKPDGSYSLPLPADAAGINYNVMSDDYINAVNVPLIPPLPQNVTFFPGDDYLIDFVFKPPTAFIEGSVMGMGNIPLGGVEVRGEFYGPFGGNGGGPLGKANPDRPRLNVRATTDSTGHYLLGVIGGTWRVNAGLDGTPYQGQFMSPGEKDSIGVRTGMTEGPIDFLAYPIDAMFSGTVSWDGNPVSDLEMYAWSPEGYNWTRTDSSGYYEIGVNSNFMYSVQANQDEIPPGLDIMPQAYRDVSPGPNFDFVIGTLPSEIEGYVYDMNTNMPIAGANIYVQEMNILVKDGGMPFDKGTQTDSSGYYYMSLPNGDFGIHVDAHDQGYFQADSGFSAFDTSITMDFYLQAAIPGYVVGNVKDFMGNNLDSAIVGAIPNMIVKSNPDISLDNMIDNLPFATYTDASGNYELKVPSGSYVIMAGKPGFVNQFYDHANGFFDADPVNVPENDTVFAVDFNLDIGGALSGWVGTVDGDTVRRGQVMAIDTMMSNYGGPVKADMEFYADIMYDGTYTFDALPPGTYYVLAFAEGFEPMYYDQARNRDEAATVDVVSGSPATGIDFELWYFNPSPDLGMVMDVPMDQGLQVQLAFKGSSFDNPIFMELGGSFGDGGMAHINKYSVWRSLPFTPGDSVLQSVGTLEDLLKSNTKLNKDSKYLQDGMLWTFIDEVPAVYLPIYGYVAPTLHDSSAMGPFITAFGVVAHSDDTGMLFPGKPMIGYSVDNLKPNMPGNVLVAPVDQNAELSWDAVDAPDLIYYRVYRSETQGFTPEASNLLGETEDLVFTDAGIQPGTTYYYKVGAVDDAFNETVSDEAVLSVTGVEDEGIPTEFELDQNYPNPFNPTTTIRFGLPEASDVRILVYSILGEKVATILDETREAGYHRITFDASSLSSGLYIYQIQAGEFKQVRKMMLMK